MAEAAGERRSRRGVSAWLPRSNGVLLVLPAALWLVVFGVAPLVLLVAMSFWTSSIFGTTPDLTLDNYRVIADDPTYARIMVQTLRIAFTVTVTVLSLLVSYPMAYFVATRSARAKGFGEIAVGGHAFRARVPAGLGVGREVFVALRYERLEVVSPVGSGDGVEGVLVEESYRGATVQRRIDLGPIGIVLSDTANTGRQPAFRPGEPVRVRWAPDGATVLPASDPGA